MSSQTIKKTNSIARNPAREAGETIIEGTIVKKTQKIGERETERERVVKR
jgi:hypothetical protein